MTETVQENVVIQFAAKFQVIFFFGFQARDDSTPGHCLAIPLKQSCVFVRTGVVQTVPCTLQKMWRIGDKEKRTVFGENVQCCVNNARFVTTKTLHVPPSEW